MKVCCAIVGAAALLGSGTEAAKLRGVISNKLAASKTTVPLAAFAGARGNYDVSLEVRFGDEYSETLMMDSGNDCLIAASYNKIKAAQPNLETLYMWSEATPYVTPWNDKGAIVQGNVSVGDAVFKNVIFWACIEDGCPKGGGGNFGMGMNSQVKGWWDSPIALWSLPSPLMQVPAGRPERESNVGNFVTYDYSNKAIVFADSGPDDCTWLEAVSSGSSEEVWTSLFIDSLTINGVATAWATGNAGSLSASTLGFADTGGGPLFLSWGNEAGRSPIVNNPSYQSKPCPGGEWNPGPSYSECECFYEDIEMSLAGSGSAASPKVSVQYLTSELEEGYPTLISCKTANVGGNDWANLGGLLFHLNTVTFDFSTRSICIQK